MQWLSESFAAFQKLDELLFRTSMSPNAALNRNILQIQHRNKRVTFWWLQEAPLSPIIICASLRLCILLECFLSFISIFSIMFCTYIHFCWCDRTAVLFWNDCPSCVSALGNKYFLAPRRLAFTLQQVTGGDGTSEMCWSTKMIAEQCPVIGHL